ncbi:MAG: hypothetical protein AAF378_09960 [Cyanobacteria bacterium P01_A01_bin.84]
MSNQHRRFLLIGQSGVQGVLNFLENGLIVWFIHGSSNTIAIWDGTGGIVLDLLLTGLLLPFFICVIISPIVAFQVRSGKVLPLPPEQFVHSRWFRRASWMRGLFLGVVGVIFGALPVVSALILAEAESFPMLSYMLFKAVWAAILASLVAPIIGWWALANASRKLLGVSQREVRKS